MAATEAAGARQAELDAYARQDEAGVREVMRRHADHVQEAATGYTSAQWQAFQQARVQALADAGYDAGAPVGSAAHPELLVDGQTLTPMRGPAVAAEAARARYEAASGVDAVLRRNAAELAAWNAPAIRRQREICLEQAIARHGPPPAGHPAAGYSPPADDDDDWLSPEARRAADLMCGLTYQAWLPAGDY